MQSARGVRALSVFRRSPRSPRSFWCRVCHASRSVFPNCALEFLTSIRLVDLSREEFDIAVRYGPGGWEGVQSEPLSSGTLMPVCSTDVFAQAGGDVANLLADNRLIQSAASNEWRNWADAAGIDLAQVLPTFIMEEFTVAIAGALAGEGLRSRPTSSSWIASGAAKWCSSRRSPHARVIAITSSTPRLRCAGLSCRR